MPQIEDFQEGIEYSDEVINAVRYGYQYRKQAENKDRSEQLHYFLPFDSDVVLWLGMLIINGLAWDLVKVISKQLYAKLIRNNTKIDEISKSLLIDETELQKFYTCLREYQDYCMSVTDEQFEHIREEICADYFAKESSKIMEKEYRFPNDQEILDIHNRATRYADGILRGRKGSLPLGDKPEDASLLLFM